MQPSASTVGNPLLDGAPGGSAAAEAVPLTGQEGPQAKPCGWGLLECLRRGSFDQGLRRHTAVLFWLNLVVSALSILRIELEYRSKIFGLVYDDDWYTIPDDAEAEASKFSAASELVCWSLPIGNLVCLVVLISYYQLKQKSNTQATSGLRRMFLVSTHAVSVESQTAAEARTSRLRRALCTAALLLLLLLPYFTHSLTHPPTSPSLSLSLSL